MIGLKEIKDSFLHLLFPHICCGCGSDIVGQESTICIRCLSEMPETNFQMHGNNPIEKIFWGRLPVVNATAQYYFAKESLMQRLMHQVKYQGNKELAKQLGCLMGSGLQQTVRFSGIQAVVPLPLFPAREKKRGYNQATVLCEGIAEKMNVEIIRDAIIRTRPTETQTKKARMERWQNVEGKFELIRPERLDHKHVLLVDDVITTGATLEACGREILRAADTRLSIATLCFASR